MNDREKISVSKMIRIYCCSKHGAKKGICDECHELKLYAYQRLEKCKFGEDKPTCETCPIHCYKPQMRERVKEVMRYAGPRVDIRSCFGYSTFVSQVEKSRKAHEIINLYYDD